MKAQSTLKKTPIGYLPKKGDINLKGIEDEVTSEVEDKLLAVDRDLWKKEVEEMKEFYKQFGDKLPDGLKQELADLEARLG